MKNESSYLERKREKIEKIFAKKSERFPFEAELGLKFIEKRPIVDENVYGEAFLEEKKISLEIFAPEASDKEIEKNICHELIHIKNPNLSHDDPQFDKKVNRYLN